MLNKRFVSAVLKARPDMRFFEGYFFMTPYDIILSGICCQITRSGGTIRTFIFPLFDRSELIHIGYSKSLAHPNGFLDLRKIARKDLATEFLRHVEKVSASTPTIADFIAFVRSNEVILANPNIRLTYACALTIQGNEAESRSQLEMAQTITWPYRDQSFADDCSLLLQALQTGLPSAQIVVENWIEAARRKWIPAELRQASASRDIR